MEVETLNQTIYYKLENAIRAYRQFAQREIRAAGYQITIDQWLTIKNIAENPDITQHDLAEKTFKDAASITRIIDLLVKGGLLERQVNEQDRRRSILTVTNKGAETIRDVSRVIRKNRKAALRGIDPDQLIAADRFLEILTANCLG